MLLRPIRRVSFAAALFACATTPPVASAPPAAHDPTAIAIAAAITARWTGILQPTQSRTGDAVVTERQKAYGTVELTVPRDRPSRTHVRLNVSTPATANVTTLRWGIYPGYCGSGASPILPVDVLPRIDLSNNGQGSLDQEIALEMPKGGAFHVNVLHGSSGTQINNVLTCGNLRQAK